MTQEEDKKQEEIFNRIFDHMLFILNDQRNDDSVNQLVASSMLAIAIRLYKTALTEKDYKQFLETLLETAQKAKPFLPKDFEYTFDDDEDNNDAVMLTDITGAKSLEDIKNLMEAQQLKRKNKLN